MTQTLGFTEGIPDTRRPMQQRPNRGLRRPAYAASSLAFALSVVYLIPLVWVLSMSVRTASEILDPTIVPQSFQPWTNVSDAWQRYDLGLLLWNSLLMTVGTVVLSVALSVTAAYGFTLLRTRFSELLFTIMLLGLMIPPAAVIVPFFIGMRQVGLYDSLTAVVIGESVFVLPLGVLIMRAYIENVPPDLANAARVDGAGEVRLFFFIVLPIIRPAVATVTLLVTLFAWNGFLLPLVLLRDSDKATVTLGLSQYSGQLGSFEWHLVAAASVIAALPLLILFYAARRYYVQGLTAGAIKN